jgi:DNA-binding CsgD family transcriptional regulator
MPARRDISEKPFELYRCQFGVELALEGRPMSPRRGSRAKQASLTPREEEVLTWVALGKSAWEIGEILDIAKRTVDEHVQTAVRKLGAMNRTHAVAIAVRDRIISI